MNFHRTVYALKKDYNSCSSYLYYPGILNPLSLILRAFLFSHFLMGYPVKFNILQKFICDPVLQFSKSCSKHKTVPAFNSFS